MEAKPKAVRYKALEMYQQGESMQNISVSLGVSKSTINQWVKRLGTSKKARRVENAARTVTVSISQENWAELEKQAVKSVYINEALRYYAEHRKMNDGQLSFNF